MFSQTGSVLLVMCFLAVCEWGASFKPRQCIDKFEIYQNHTMCLGDPSQHLNESERHEIEDKHNDIRQNVQPGANKMMELGYALALEKEAQTWADQCRLDHDEPYFRFQSGRYHVGQNIYIGKNLSWSDVIDIWAMEKDHFKYNNSGNDRAAVGNYTQMIFEDTVLVGCGKKECGSVHFYVCNYAPSILDRHINIPYEQGDTNSGCHGHFSNVTQNLCSCVGKFCTNGGTLDLTNCECRCVPGVQTYDAHICELNCTNDGDHVACKSMNEAACRTDVMAPFKCPWLCKVCPYGGKNYRQNSVRMPWETTITPSTATVKGQTHGTATTSKRDATTSNPATTKATGKSKGAAQQKGAASTIQASTLLAASLCLASIVFLLM